MRDKKSHNHHLEADDREAGLLVGMEHEQEDALLAEAWSKIPDQKPAIRPTTHDVKSLVLLKRKKLLPTETQLAEMQKILDDIEGHKHVRAKLLAELQALPTTQDVRDSYEWLAYSLTFHDDAHHPTLFQYHQTLHPEMYEEPKSPK